MSIDWTGLLPFLILGGGGTLIFLVGAFWRRRPAGVLFALALATSGAAAAATLALPSLGPGLEGLLDLGGYFRFFTTLLMFDYHHLPALPAPVQSDPRFCRG